MSRRRELSATRFQPAWSARARSSASSFSLVNSESGRWLKSQNQVVGPSGTPANCQWISQSVAVYSK